MILRIEPANWKLECRGLPLRNVGRFSLHLSRPVEGEIKTVTIRRSSTGRWYASFSCDSVPEKALLPTGKDVGIDVSVRSFCVDSDGGTVQNPRFLYESEKLLRRRQRVLSLDRDHNAAINILRRSTVGATGSYARGEAALSGPSSNREVPSVRAG